MKGVFITGATSGIGRALAKEYAAQGDFKIVATGRRLPLLEQLRDEILQEHPSAIVIVAQLDVSDVSQVRKVFHDAIDRIGGVHVVIANAGTASGAFIGHGSENFETQSEIVRVNLIGAMATIDCAVEYFRKVGGGHVVGSLPLSFSFLLYLLFHSFFLPSFLLYPFIFSSFFTFPLFPPSLLPSFPPFFLFLFPLPSTDFSMITFFECTRNVFSDGI